MAALRRHLLSTIDRVLAQPNSEESYRREAVSLKKLMKGDGAWSTRKIILGWVIDTVRQTVELPPHRKAELAAIFASLAQVQRISHKRYQQILGKLRFVSMAIPGSAGLFSALQLALNQSKGNRIRVSRLLRQHINAFASLAASLCHRPTHLAEIVPQDPSYVGVTDAAKAGMGGVYYSPDGQGHVWRVPFPDDVQDRLVSVTNPSGDVTNSDLEHCGLITQVALIAERHDVRHATIASSSDNTPAVARVAKGAVSSPGAAALLCNYACLHQRQHEYCHQASYIPGPINVMADDASRLQHLTDAQFLSHFEQNYPQDKDWLLVRPNDETVSSMISTLRCKSQPPAPPPRHEPARAPPSMPGLTSSKEKASCLPSLTLPGKRTSSTTSSSSACDIDKEAALATLSELLQLQKRSWQWERGSPTWVSPIPASKDQPESSIPYSVIFSADLPKRMARRTAPTLPTCKSYGTSSTPATWITTNGDSPTSTSSTSSLSLSSGFSDQLNTSTLLPKDAHKPSPSDTYISWPTVTPTRPRRSL